MASSYEISTETATDLLSVILHGFFSIEDMKPLKHDLTRAINTFSCGRGKHLAMYDVRDCKIQSQLVVHTLRSFSDEKGVAARRIAIVTGNSLMRMQIPRIVVDRDAKCFDEPFSARIWLLARSMSAFAETNTVKHAVFPASSAKPLTP